MDDTYYHPFFYGIYLFSIKKFYKMQTLSTLFLILALFSSSLEQNLEKEVTQGDILIIMSSEDYSYTHIKFPRGNFIRKKGSLPNYKNLHGIEVVVKEVQTLKNGAIKVILERRDGKKFFNSFSEISADYKKAILAGELEPAG